MNISSSYYFMHILTRVRPVRISPTQSDFQFGWKFSFLSMLQLKHLGINSAYFDPYFCRKCIFITKFSTQKNDRFTLKLGQIGGECLRSIPYLCQNDTPATLVQSIQSNGRIELGVVLFNSPCLK